MSLTQADSHEIKYEPHPFPSGSLRPSARAQCLRWRKLAPGLIEFADAYSLVLAGSTRAGTLILSGLPASHVVFTCSIHWQDAGRRDALARARQYPETRFRVIRPTFQGRESPRQPSAVLQRTGTNESRRYAAVGLACVSCPQTRSPTRERIVIKGAQRQSGQRSVHSAYLPAHDTACLKRPTQSTSSPASSTPRCLSNLRWQLLSLTPPSLRQALHPCRTGPRWVVSRLLHLSHPPALVFNTTMVSDLALSGD